MINKIIGKILFVGLRFQTVTLTRHKITFIRHEMMTFQLNRGMFTILHNYKEIHTSSDDCEIFMIARVSI